MTTLMVIGAGLGVHFLLPDTAGTDIAGDALYAAAVYAFVILIIPRRPALLVGAIALAWCIGVELFQLTGVPLAAGEAFLPAMLVLGTVFDPRDLVIYASTILVFGVVDAAISRARAESSSRSSSAARRSSVSTVATLVDVVWSLTPRLLLCRQRSGPVRRDRTTVGLLRTVSRGLRVVARVA
ncbi:DUF2809 domain-containing protein [Microbacterium sp. NPDC076895]|uniref:ribosomal maturation YjgA family protein n=1 Tax=Microbacterium sp. NPDC076895 TaxID=3154957 RepID=UPI003443641C